MASQEEIQAEIERIVAELMTDVAVADSVKAEVVSLSLVIECCFKGAEIVVRKFGTKIPGMLEEALLLADFKKEVAFKLFDSLIMQMMTQKQAGPTNITSDTLRQLGIG